MKAWKLGRVRRRSGTRKALRKTTAGVKGRVCMKPFEDDPTKRHRTAARPFLMLPFLLHQDNEQLTSKSVLPKPYDQVYLFHTEKSVKDGLLLRAQLD